MSSLVSYVLLSFLDNFKNIASALTALLKVSWKNSHWICLETYQLHEIGCPKLSLGLESH